MASLMKLVCFLRDISNYRLSEWLSLLLQASPDVLCDIQVVKWVPHNNHFSINFYMLNWLYDLQVAIMIYFLALTDQSIAFISQISTKNNCFLLLSFIPSRLADSYSFAIRYIRLRSKSSNTECVQTQYVSDLLLRKDDPDPDPDRDPGTMVGIICSATLSGRGTLNGSSLQNLNSSCSGEREKFCWGGGNIICPNETCWSQMHKMILSWRQVFFAMPWEYGRSK